MSFRNAKSEVARYFGPVDGTLLAKIKQLQRMQWPPATNVGLANKAEWSSDDIADLISVLALMEAGLPPSRAIPLARANLSEMRCAIANGETITIKSGRATISIPFTHARQSSS